MEGLAVRCIVVFRKEGLQLEGLRKDLAEYGEIIDEEDNVLELVDGDTPVRLICMEMPFGKYFGFKMKYNCVEAEDNHYVLFPMESFQEKMKVIRARK